MIINNIVKCWFHIHRGRRRWKLFFFSFVKWIFKIFNIQPKKKNWNKRSGTYMRQFYVSEFFVFYFACSTKTWIERVAFLISFQANSSTFFGLRFCRNLQMFVNFTFCIWCNRHIHGIRLKALIHLTNVLLYNQYCCHYTDLFFIAIFY